MIDSCAKRAENKSNVEVMQDAQGSIFIRSKDRKQIADYSKRKEHYATQPNSVMEIQLAEEGFAAVKPQTIPQIFSKNATQKADLMAVQWEDTSLPDKPLTGWTWSKYYSELRKVAKAFIALGLKEHECVDIIGFNSKEWFMAEVGAIFAGGKACGIYTTNGPQACEYIVDHSEAKFVFCENASYLKKFVGLGVPSVQGYIVWGEDVSAELKGKFTVPVYSFDQFVKRGEVVSDAVLQARMDGCKPGACAVLIYTSGTTGNPKACMISHDNFIFAATCAFSTIQPNMTSDEAMVSYLPLSHIAGQQLDIIGPAIATAECSKEANICVTFARPDALKGTLVETLKKVRPTIFLGVPRVYEKMMETMKAAAAKSDMGAVLKALVNWSKGRALQKYYDNMPGGAGGSPFGYAIAQKLLNKIYEKLGFDRCYRHCLTGAAPISKEVLEYFGSLGINIKEIFGMSETSAIGTVSSNTWYKVSSCGPVAAGTEIMLLHVPGRDPPGHGELCMRGRQVMMGYMKEEQKTRETIDPQGWLHSGDVASVDEWGMVSITGRIKELIITAGGENIAPVPIEDFVKAKLPCIANCMVVGDRLKFNTLLVTLKTKTDQTGDVMSNELVGPAIGFNGSKATSTEEAKVCPLYLKGVEEGIKAYNAQAVSNAQKVQKFKIVDGDFTVKGGELTATLKLKRNEVVKKYQSVIDEMYAGSQE